MRKLSGIAALLFIFSTCSIGQVVDSFSDGDFSVNPVWQGDTSSFIVNANKQLQLNESGSGQKYLVTFSHYLLNTTWEFWLDLQFDPSANNYIQVYLSSNSSNLTGTLDGYYIRIGENGANDGINLYRQSGSTKTLLIDGSVANLSSKPKLRVKVSCSSSGTWTLWSDAGSGSYVVEGSASDKQVSSSGYMGLLCTYTSSNAKAIYFDDLYIRPFEIDSTPPKMQSVKAVSAKSIELDFSEPLKENSATAVNNYLLLPDSVQPVLCTIENNSKVVLDFSNELKRGKGYKIIATNMQDLSNNISDPDTLNFQFFIPLWGDVVINEIMADPVPVIGLPAAEYLEIFNTSGNDINLEHWILTDLVKNAELPAYELKNGEYLILTSPANVNSFSSFGPVLGIDLPSLNNSGDFVILKTASGELMDSLYYDTRFYHDKSKQDGGWSIERIRFFYPCQAIDNWSASTDPKGGTPGTSNSVSNSATDTVAPSITSYSFSSPSRIIVYFSETLNPSGFQPGDILMLCGNGIKEASFPGDNRIVIDLSSVFHDRDTCTLKFRNIADCLGNKMDKYFLLKIQYHEPGQAKPFEIVIDEIMADPEPVIHLPPVEYLELYNRSDKYLQLENWRITTGSATGILPDFLISPHEWLILCNENDAGLLKSFGNTLGIKNFPSLPNSGGNITLSDSNDIQIHQVAYDNDWYHDDFKKQGGWALEMIDPGNYCEGENNWTASADKQGGTPGQLNSVDAVNPDMTDPEITGINVFGTQYLSLNFSEKMDFYSLTNSKAFQFDDQVPVVYSVQPDYPVSDSVSIFFTSALTNNLIYSCGYHDLMDCAGNKINGTFRFGLPEKPDSTDIVINEVLFNPYTGGYDFIELFNRSGKIIQTNGLVIASYNEDGEIIQAYPVGSHLLFPLDYAVLTVDKSDLENRYNVKNPFNVIEMSSMPSFNDDEGDVVLLTNRSVLLDHFHYTKDMHSILLQDEEGVSLERLSPDKPTNDPANWFSASSDAGYATPTYKNSQFSEFLVEDNTITVSPEIFTPDFDGTDDQLLITYKLNKPGYQGSIKIYNTAGRLVKTLNDHFLAGSTGFMTWDGSTDDGIRAPMGVYILLIKLHHPMGDTRIFKETATLFLPLK